MPNKTPVSRRAAVAASIPEGLKIRTLANIFEASRSLEQLFPMAKTSTTKQLSQLMDKVRRSPDLLAVMFLSLERLQNAAAEMGDTTLVQPTVHPMVNR